jgi:acetolactate synthase-1/2/3 large subunit
MRVSDYIASHLFRLGITHVFGVGGANIEDMFAAVQRRRPETRAVLSKHEHAAGTAADAYARITGGLGVVLTTSGGGAMNLVHSVAEARASLVPVLAIVGEPPRALQGRGAFQDTSGQAGTVDAAAVFGATAKWCTRAADPEDVPRLLDEAIAAALAPPRGPSVLLLAKDFQQAEIQTQKAANSWRTPSVRPPDTEALRRLVSAMQAPPVVIIAGEQVARFGAWCELASLVQALDAKVAVTPDARDVFDNGDPRFLGVAGAMGHPEVARAIAEARTCLVIGTRLPLLARQGLESVLAEKKVISVGNGKPHVGPRDMMHVECELSACLRSLASELTRNQRIVERDPSAFDDEDEDNFLVDDIARPAKTTGNSVANGLNSSEANALTSANMLQAVARSLPDGSVVLVDAGNTGASSIHEVRAPRDGHWLVAMGMAGMGYTFGAAVGAACATGRRCTVIAGDGAFFMQGLDVHTAVEHELPITYVILNNGAHGMCLVRERLLLADNAGYNAFRRSHIGAGLAAMFPRLSGRDCRSMAELEEALAHAAERRGPSVIAVELPEVEVPPFAAFQQVRGGAPRTVDRGIADEND